MNGDPTVLVLRLLHVVGGVYWGGAIFFTVLFLGPAVRDVGPDGARVMQGIQARGFMRWTPAVALLVILSGLDLMRRMSGNFQPVWFGTPRGITLSLGTAATIVAFVIGYFVMRPAMVEAGRLAAEGGDPARVGALRLRATAASRIVGVLLLVAVMTMAVGRYV
jgi:uncharacterized membrane protein